MTEYTVHFLKGRVVGARSLRMVSVEANSPAQAIKIAKQAFYPRDPGYKVDKVDHFEDGRRVRDC